MHLDLLTLAYVGPETILPVTSVLAAAGGLLLLFWANVKRFFLWFTRFLPHRRIKG